MTAHAKVNRLAWWQEARFGMFIHWGVYAIPGRGEWVYYQEHFETGEYARFADQFNPKHYNPAEWVALAQEAGMKYMVLTTRHHDGFCLFDSKVSEFTAPKTAAQRDLIAEYVEACRAAGMPVGLYYSLEDWRFPGQLPHLPQKEDSVYAPMVEQAHAQVRELCSNYGKIDILWFDGGFPSSVWRSEELIRMIRSLQPEILINNRAGLPEDFGTPENVVVPEGRPWEACYTMNDSWGYALHDHNYKSVSEILRLLVSCVARDGNLLLNVGPDAEGRIPPEAVDRLRRVGQWMKTNGAAIHGAGSSPVIAPALGWSTRAGDKVYFPIQRWPGSTVPFAWCGSRVKSARLLATGQEARVEQRGDRVWLHGFPECPPDPDLSVIELSFDGPIQANDPAYT
ncbi:MAG: alpha-L-fucosidase [Candidatus Hydrogenedentes bacterium]|nr:alpha-L-fucosidase [Candidatus Hydrogenedentota bacterium]